MHGALMNESFQASMPVWWEYEPETVSYVWRGVHCQPGSERQACIWLRRHGLKPRWFRFRAEPTRDIKSRRNVRWRSVIPGYLFLPVPLSRSIDSSFFDYAPGIRGFMRNAAGTIVRLKEEEIEQIA